MFRLVLTESADSPLTGSLRGLQRFQLLAQGADRLILLLQALRRVLTVSFLGSHILLQALYLGAVALHPFFHLLQRHRSSLGWLLR
ncbi:MAG: hypothetical protein WC617_04620 [Rhodanobacter sp.]